jgi:ElaB/YqjD/DUF883 family membrane-anchored ribosome-binding protein
MADDKKIGEQVSSVGNAVKEGIASAAAQAQTAAAQAGSTIQDAATEVSKQVGDAGAKAGAKAADYVSRKTAEQPLLALLVAGAIGYGIAYLIHARSPAL